MKAVSQNGQQVNKEDIDDTVSAIMFDIIDLSPINILLTNKIGTKGLRRTQDLPRPSKYRTFLMLEILHLFFFVRSDTHVQLAYI